MTQLRRFQNCLLAMAMLALAAYAASEQQPELFAFCAPWAAAGWYLSERRGWRGMPRWLSTLILCGIIVRVIYEAANPPLSITPFMSFLAWIIILKLWDRRTVKDFGQVTTIAAFLHIGAILNSNSLAVGLILLVSVPTFVYGVMLLQLVIGEAAAGESAGAGQPADGASVGTPVSGPVPRQLAGLSIWAVVAGFFISVFVFVLVPRGIGGSAFGLIEPPSIGRVTGFSDRVELGLGGLISESQAVVMEVAVRRPDPAGAASVLEPLYLRGAVLTEYAGGQWTAPRTRRRSQMVVDRGPETSVGFTAGPRVELLVEHRASRSEGVPLFALWRPVAVQFEDELGRVVFDSNTGAFSRRGQSGPMRYRVVSAIPEPAANEAGELAPARDPLRPHGFDPAVAALATKAIADAGLEPDPERRPRSEDTRVARTLEAFLRSRCSYTLDILAAPAGVDPIAWFLTDGKQGHCEYFASALAAMLTTVGIESRVVTGYAAAEIDDASGKYVVRESNAHAWVEAEVGPDLWRTFDATPSAALERVSQRSDRLTARLWRWFDGIESAWADSIVGYNNRSVGQDVTRRLMPTGRWLADAGEEGATARRRLPAWLWGAPVALGAVIAAGVLGRSLIRWLLRRFWGRRDPRFGRGGVADGPEADLYRRTLRVLAKLGYVRPPWRPGLSFLREEFERDHPELGRLAAAAMDPAYRYWFGDRRAGRTEMAEARAALERLVRLAAAKRRGT